MVKKLAIDWDDSELRLVAAQCSGNSVKVTETALIQIKDGDVKETLRDAIAQLGLENTEVLVAIGRGKAELRDLQLPEVPDDELPDMVRFQAIRSFASAGDSATVDYLVTNRADNQISLLAAAVGPAKLKEIQDTASTAQLKPTRIALRPLAAAALFLAKNKTSGETVLIDLLADDAEIVVARDGKVVFVRTVRMPSDAAARSTALAGELKRSLIACGSAGKPEAVILWGNPSVHGQDAEKLRDAVGGNVEVIDPFSLVDVSKEATSALPDHVGRLAPLVGLLQNDSLGGHHLIDFLNPRKRVVQAPNPLRKIILIGAPIAAVLLLGFFAYRKIKDLDRQIATLQGATSELREQAKLAESSIEKTGYVDDFLDSDVNWLDEMKRLADKMPSSKEMIVRQISGNADDRRGGGTLTVKGGVTSSDVIINFRDSMGDENHGVVPENVSEDTKAKDQYRWAYNEKVTVSPTYIHDLRYERLGPDYESKSEAADAGAAEQDGQAETADEPNTESDTESKSAEESPEMKRSADPAESKEETKATDEKEGSANESEESDEEVSA